MKKLGQLDRDGNRSEITSNFFLVPPNNRNPFKLLSADVSIARCDLAVAEQSHQPTDPTTGNEITFFVTVTNIGRREMSGHGGA